MTYQEPYVHWVAHIRTEERAMHEACRNWRNTFGLGKDPEDEDCEKGKVCFEGCPLTARNILKEYDVQACPGCGQLALLYEARCWECRDKLTQEEESNKCQGERGKVGQQQKQR